MVGSAACSPHLPSLGDKGRKWPLCRALSQRSGIGESCDAEARELRLLVMAFLSSDPSGALSDKIDELEDYCGAAFNTWRGSAIQPNTVRYAVISSSVSGCCQVQEGAQRFKTRQNKGAQT